MHIKDSVRQVTLSVLGACLPLFCGLTLALLCRPAAAADNAVIERGRYLANTILACGNCHTPKDARGNPIANRELAGGGLTFNLPPFAGMASNITPDMETGIGAWSDQEIRAAISQGERPNHGRLAGKPLGLPMWVNFYKALLPTDLDAVVAYLRSIPPVRNEIPPPTYRVPVHRERYPDAERGFNERDMQDPVRRGAYLVTVGHCMECHTPIKNGATLYEEAFGAGGRPYLPGMVKGYPEDWPGTVSRNLTADPEVGLGRWSDSEIKRAISDGIGRDGRKLMPPMGFHWYSGLNTGDLDAIVAWLRTLPPKH